MFVTLRNGNRELTWECTHVEKSDFPDTVRVELCPQPANGPQYITLPTDGTDVFVMNDNGDTIMRFRWPRRDPASASTPPKAEFRDTLAP